MNDLGFQKSVDCCIIKVIDIFLPYRFLIVAAEDMGMRKSVGQIVRDLQGAFVHSTGYIRRDSLKIRKQVQEKLAETNCMRILAVAPVLILIAVYNIVSLNSVRAGELFPVSLALSIAVILLALLFSGMIVWILYLNDIDNSKEIWKCKILHRVFWWTWFLGMAGIALCRVECGKGYDFFVIICMVICIVPLHSFWEFCLLLGFAYAFFVWTASIADRMGVDYQAFETVMYAGIALLVVGFVAQQFEVGLRTLQEYIQVKTFIDPLTGLLNRRGANAVLEEELSGKRGCSFLGLVMLDIDYFKKYNDSLGHDAGDGCLALVAECVREAAGGRTRLLIRHGGEEFVAIFPGIYGEELKELAEKIRMAVFDRGIPAPASAVAEVVTVSVGTAEERLPEVSTDRELRYEDLLLRADEALYAAKAAGRNRVVSAGEPVESR